MAATVAKTPKSFAETSANGPAPEPVQEHALIDGRIDISVLTRDQLVAELDRRGLDTNGTKLALRNRMLDYIMEKMRWGTKKLAADTAALAAQAELEQRGSVYAAGLNALGTEATCAVYSIIPEFRGACAVHVAAADDYCVVVTANKCVYAFGRPTAPIFEVSAADAAKLSLASMSKPAFSYATARSVGGAVEQVLSDAFNSPAGFGGAGGGGGDGTFQLGGGMLAPLPGAGTARSATTAGGSLGSGGRSGLAAPAFGQRDAGHEAVGSGLSAGPSIFGASTASVPSLGPFSMQNEGLQPAGAAAGALDDAGIERSSAAAAGGARGGANGAGRGRAALGYTRSLDASVAELGKPRAVPGLDGERIVFASAGCGYASAVSDGGDLHMWGAGQLGHASLTTDPHLVRRHVACQVAAMADTAISDAVFGDGFAALLDAESGAVYVWGSNRRGYLGLDPPPQPASGVATAASAGAQGSGGGGGAAASDATPAGDLTESQPTRSPRRASNSGGGADGGAGAAPSAVRSGRAHLPPVLPEATSALGQTALYFSDARAAPAVYGFSTSVLHGGGASRSVFAAAGQRQLPPAFSGALPDAAGGHAPWLAAPVLAPGRVPVGRGIAGRSPGGSALQVHVPTRIRSLAGAGVVVRQIACGGHHVVALADNPAVAAAAAAAAAGGVDGTAGAALGAPAAPAPAFYPVYAWGAGDGYRLGHGDLEDRFYPCPVDGLKGQTVYQVAASETATYAIVQRRGLMSLLLDAGLPLPPPPAGSKYATAAGVAADNVHPATQSVPRKPFGKVARRGVTFGGATTVNIGEDAEGGGDADESARAAAERATQRLLSAYRGNSLVVWGTGTNGQLGLGPGTTEARTPTLVPAFEEEHASVRFVACSSTHAAAIAGRASSLYVWGHNRFHALGLGPDMESTLVLYAPARVTQFGTIVDGVGRGVPRSVACGKYFTVVATHAYAGVDAREAAAAAARGKLMEDDKARASELEMRRKLAVEKAEEEERLRQVAALNELSFAAPPPCSLCSACSGFQADPFAPSLCRCCAHLRSRHNTKADLKRHALLGSALLKPPGATSAGGGGASGAGSGGDASSGVGLRERGGHSFRY